MILDELVLHNFGVYRGRQSVILTPPTGGRKPVVLFGGMNGGGKTTLLDGLQLALYGKAAHCSNRGSLAYPDYLERCINARVAKADGAALEVRFRHRSEGVEHEFRVQRSWHASTSGAIRERLEVLRDDKEDPVLADAWMEHVEEFMPCGLSHLFLFDGEKIESLAETESSARLLSTAIGALLGLDLIEQLSTDLVVLERRKRSAGRNEVDTREIATAQIEVDALALRVADLVAERASAQNELDLAVKKLTKLDARFQKEGGEIYERRNLLEAERGSLLQQIVDAENHLRDAAADVLPLVVVSTILDGLSIKDRIEAEAEGALALGKVLAQRDARLTRELKKRGAKSDLATWVTKFLATDREARIQAANIAPHLCLTSDARAVLVGLAGTLEDARKRSRESVQKLEKLRAGLDRLDRRLASVPTPEAISGLQEERDEARGTAEAAKARLAGLDSELQRTRRAHELKKEQLVRHIEKQVKSDFATEDAIRVVRHAKRARETLTTFRGRLVERHVKRIEQLILESFQGLLRKRTLVSRLSIDPRTFAVELRDQDGAILAAERLSAGERQLLAVSMLWGLAKASGRALPAVIDTPLGRLDSTHRSHLVRRYFPYASHQVLLLSTDEEIDEQHFLELKPHVGRSYVLEFDDRAGATSVREGYFW